VILGLPNRYSPKQTIGCPWKFKVHVHKNFVLTWLGMGPEVCTFVTLFIKLHVSCHRVNCASKDSHLFTQWHFYSDEICKFRNYMYMQLTLAWAQHICTGTRQFAQSRQTSSWYRVSASSTMEEVPCRIWWLTTKISVLHQITLCM